MPAHIGGSPSPSVPGRSYNNPRTTSPSRMMLAGVGLASIAFAVYIAESYPKRQVHDQARTYQIMLPYDLYSLEPFISAETMDYHYNKHDYGYDRKLVALINNTELDGLSLIQILEKNNSRLLPPGVYNNAGQLLNHNFFWMSMTPHNSERFPAGISKALQQKLVADFGSVDAFLKEFSQKSVAWFGSGWTYAAYSRSSKRVLVINTVNGNYLAPQEEFDPILCLDIWEHAYYIDYRNRRDEYVKAFLNVANWKFASEQFEKSIGPQGIS
jgi:Fe-Mn family superoxide dismutase